jgi:hypothetical protein
MSSLPYYVFVYVFLYVYSVRPCDLSIYIISATTYHSTRSREIDVLLLVTS